MIDRRSEIRVGRIVNINMLSSGDETGLKNTPAIVIDHEDIIMRKEVIWLDTGTFQTAIAPGAEVTPVSREDEKKIYGTIYEKSKQAYESGMNGRKLSKSLPLERIRLRFR